MDSDFGVKFKEFVDGERFKNIERKLKISYIKQLEKIRSSTSKENSPLTWPSVSSIDGDETCYSTNTALQSSKIGSEVVASSFNLKHNINRQKTKNDNNCIVATSSAKKTNVRNFNEDYDKAIMPPPPVAIKNSRVRNNFVKHIETTDMEEKEISLNENLENDQDLSNTKQPRCFSKWKIALNGDGRIYVKGIVDNTGKHARGKAIAERLNSNKLVSIYHHVYILNGDLDQECKGLPDYVREKFRYGFPTDWLNVQELWKRYVDEGCKSAFRWPTPVSGSDDEDIKSDITEVTTITERRYNLRIKRESNSKSESVVYTPASSSGYSSHMVSATKINDFAANDHKNNIPNLNTPKKKTSLQSNTSSTAEKSNISIDVPMNLHQITRFLHRFMKNDIIMKMLLHLGDENCPEEDFTKFNELITFLNYVDNSRQSMLPNSDSCNINTNFQKTKEQLSNESEKWVDNGSISMEASNERITEDNNILSRIERFDSSVNNALDDESVSEYSGIPRKSLAPLLAEKADPLKLRRLGKSKKISERKEINVTPKSSQPLSAKKEYTANKPIITSTEILKSPKTFLRNKPVNKSISDISFTDATECNEMHTSTKKSHAGENVMSVSKTQKFLTNTAYNKSQNGSKGGSPNKLGYFSPSNFHVYGSKENPKILKFYNYQLICNENLNKRGFEFYGKLVNENGQCEEKIISTGIAQIVPSSKFLIENEHKEFFIVVGDSADSNFSSLKQLQQYNKDTAEMSNCNTAISHETSLENLNVSRSSKGRRLLRPVNYFCGERVCNRYQDSESKTHEVCYQSGLHKNENKSPNPTVVTPKNESSRGPVQFNSLLRKSENKEKRNYRSKNKDTKRIYYITSESSEEDLIAAKPRTRGKANSSKSNKRPIKRLNKETENQVSNSKSTKKFKKNISNSNETDTDVSNTERKTIDTFKITYKKNVQKDEILSEDQMSLRV